MKFELGAGETQFASGLGTIHYIPHHVTDPAHLSTGIYVRCGKHPEKWIPVECSLLMDGFERGDAILQAFKSCPECLELETNRIAHMTSRFPEGAEL